MSLASITLEDVLLCGVISTLFIAVAALVRIDNHLRVVAKVLQETPKERAHRDEKSLEYVGSLYRLREKTRLR